MSEFKVTHLGWFAGLAPVKIDFTDVYAPGLEARYWWLNWWLDIVEVLFGVFCYCMTTVNPSFYPNFPIMVTKVVDWHREPIEEILSDE